jgi:hypothetical protein
MFKFLIRSAGRVMTRWSTGFWLIVLMACSASAAGGQAAVQMHIAALRDRVQVVREINDPHTGDRWLLERNPENLGGPWRMVLIPGTGHPDAGAAKVWQPKAEMLPVIHSGDRIVIEEHTAVADVSLTAVAMEPSLTGGAFNARLTVGGKVVRATALGKGRAVFASDTGRRP